MFLQDLGPGTWPLHTERLRAEQVENTTIDLRGVLGLASGPGDGPLVATALLCGFKVGCGPATAPRSHSTLEASKQAKQKPNAAPNPMTMKEKRMKPFVGVWPGDPPSDKVLGALVKFLSRNSTTATAELKEKLVEECGKLGNTAPLSIKRNGEVVYTKPDEPPVM